MNITQAILKTAFITNSDLRAKIFTLKIILLLVSGELDICDKYGLTMTAATMCEVCENEWADQMVEKEEQMSFGRYDVYAHY